MMRARFRKALASVCVLLMMSLVVACKERAKPEERLPVVGITQIATHPALDEVRNGMINQLAELGFEDGTSVSIVFRNANGDPSLTLPIVEDFVRSEVDVIVPISTPSSLAAAKGTSEIPIVFSGVTDPIGVGLVGDLTKPGGNITGVSDRWPFDAQVEAFLKYFPDTKRIGMLYTQGDDVSKIGVEEMTRIASEKNFELILQSISQASDVYTSAVSLLRDVETIYVGIDHLLLENMDGLVKASREANIPLFGGESGSVEKGAVLALSINMTEFGALTGRIVARVLKGEKPGEIPIQVVSSGDLLANRKAAVEFGLDPDQLQRDGARFVQVEEN